MKKTAAWMLILALILTALFVPTMAMAAPGDVTLFLSEDGYGSSLYVFSVATVGDTAYMIGQETGDCLLYVIRVGESEPEICALPDQLDGQESYAYSLRMFARDGKLMALNTMTGKIYELSVAGDAVSLTEAMTLDWQNMLIGEGEDRYQRDIMYTVVAGDALYVTAYDDSWMTQELIAFSLTDGSCRVVAQTDSYFGELFAGKDGELLTVIGDSDDWQAPSKLCSVSAEDGTLTEITKLANNSVSGFVYDGELDRVIYCSAGTVYASQRDGTLTELASIPLTSGGGMGQGGAGLLDGGYYLLSSYEGTIVKNLDPQYKPTRTLTIRCGYMETDKAYSAFQEKHPEAAIKALTNGGSATTDEVTQAMMNGSTEADIYQLTVSTAAYQALVNRGYAADLSSSEALSDLVSRMYPVFQDALTRDGKIIAFPKEVNADGYTISKTMAKTIGMTEEDYPDTWDKLLQLVERWDEEYSQEYPEKALFDPYQTANMKETLFNMLLDEYVVLLNKPGQELSVNTQTMRDLLKRLDSMDYSAFATDQDFSNGYSWSSEDVLLSDWGTPLPSSNYRDEEQELLLLALSDEEEALVGVRMDVYVVNPYSKNIDLAIAYLEARAETMSEGMSATLLSDWTEPIRDPYFEENMKYLEKKKTETEAALAEAGDDEKQMYENQLKDLENWYQRCLEDEYLWTTEDLAEYRELTDQLVVVENWYFNSYEGEAAEEMQQLISRYVDGQMSADQMLAALDQKLKMMQMESAY